MVACPRCGFELGDPRPLACKNCGLIFAPKHEPEVGPFDNDSPHQNPRWDAKTCTSCRARMTPMGELNVRVGGYGGPSGLFLAETGPPADKLQPFSVYHCPNCGKIDFYEPGR
jgi:predicted RNA-binding Zn-ribbon protein involved in translation (DUF1610 family)